MQTKPLSRDFQWLWGAFSVSALGSGIGAGALPIVAVLVLRASAFAVSILAALSCLASAAIALPFGPRIEYRKKRPTMISTDLIRFVALASVPVAAGLGVLTFAQLCVVGVIQTAANIAFTAASGAHLKVLTNPSQRIEANSRLETTTWISQTVGPPFGGVLITAAGATITMAIDAVSFLMSAVGVGRIRQNEPAPPNRPQTQSMRSDLTSGWQYILQRRGLRTLFINSMLFGGPVMMTSSLLAILMLRNLGFPPADYGLALGLPCIGGIVGSRLATSLTRRFGQRRILLTSGVLRTPWMLLIPFASRGIGGLALIVIAETGLLLAAGVFNPSFSTYRMEATDDVFMVRVSSSWSISSKLIQPLFIAAGGALATVVSVRAALIIGGGICLASAVFLPWEQRQAPSAVMPLTAAKDSAPARLPACSLAAGGRKEPQVIKPELKSACFRPIAARMSSPVLAMNCMTIS
jgi:predicted MFS family arabinose efflux permease